MDTDETPAELAAAASPEARIAEKIAWLETCGTALDARGLAVLDEISTPFVRATYDRVRRRIRKAGVPDADADDLLQEVFAAFFHRVKRNGAKIGLRKMLAQNTRWRILDHVDEQLLLPPTTDIPSSGTPLPESAVDVVRALHVRALAQRFLHELTPEHRAVVEKRILGDLTDAETGAALGLPEGTVKSRLRAAIRVLRELGAALPASQRDAA